MANSEWMRWLRRTFQGPQQGKPGKTRQRYRPTVESLEDRAMPTVSVVSMAAPVAGATPSTGAGQSEAVPMNSISNNGQYTVYASDATNLVANENDPAATENVYLYDNVAGTTTLVSHQYGESAWSASGTSFNPVISGDGSTIAFYSTATDIVSGVTIPSDAVELYVYNVPSGTLTLASHSYGASTTGSNGENPGIPSSPSTHWLNTLGYSVPAYPDTEGFGSGLFAGGVAAGLALPSISTDGQYIAYIDDATDLGGSDTGLDAYSGLANTNVYLYSVSANSNTLVSHAAGQTAETASGSDYGGGAYATTASISGDGSTIAFTDPGMNLVSGQNTDGVNDQLYVWSRIADSATGLSAGETVLASHEAGSTTTGATVNGGLFGFSGDSPPTLSSDGTAVAYYDQGSNLVTGQSGTASVLNVFLYNVTSNTNTLVTHTYASATTAGNNPANQVAPDGVGPAEATGPQISANGEYIAYANNSNNLLATTLPSSNAGRDNVYLYTVSTGTNTLVSNDGTGGVPDAGGGTAPSISSTSAGTFVTFADLNITAGGSLTGPAPTVNVRVFTLGSTSQPAIVGRSFVSTDPALPPLTGTGAFTAATLEFYSAALQPTLISADGSTIIWSGPAQASDMVPSVTDINLNLDVFQATNPSDSSSSNGQVPVITSSNTDTLTVGTSMTFTVTATNSPTSFGETGLPTNIGLTFNTTTGVLSGTPTTTGSFPLTVTATNSTGPSQPQTLTITVDQLPTITSTSTTFTVGTTNSFQIPTTGTPTPTFTDTNLPTGLNLTTSGLLTGLPTAGDGVYTFGVTATNSVGSDPETFTLTVDQLPSITSTSTTFTVGTTNSFQIPTTGYPTPTFTDTNLPAGLNLTTSGLLTGLPTAGDGVYTFGVTATNSVGADNETFTLTVDQLPSITTTSTTFTVGTTNSFQIPATGYATPTFTDTNLPAGLNLTSSGLLTGLPTAGDGVYTFGVTATNSVGADTETFTLTVDQLPSITTTSTTFTVGTTNSFQIPATGYATPTFTDTNLPAGLNLTSSGLLTGLPTAGDGVYTFGVTATNSVGSDPETFTLTVDQLPSITTTSTTFTVGSSNSFQIPTTGYATPTFTDTNLPAGLNLTSSGLLTGLPTAGDGVYTFGVTATNSVGSDTETFTLTVDQAPAITTTSTTFTVGTGGSFQIPTTGYPAPTFTDTGLPTGVTLTSGGVLSGTPTAGPGTYTFGVTASNGVGVGAGSDTETFTLTINPGAPTNITLTNGSVTAYQPVGTQVGAVSSTDPNAGATVTYTLTGANANLFTIDNADNLTTNSVFDTTTTETYGITVTATDSLGQSTSQPFTITVNPSSAGPANISITGGSVSTEQPIGTLIGTVSSTDPNVGQTVTYTLTGANASLFNISSTGTLTTNNVFTTAQSDSITVVATDSLGLSSTQTFTITVGSQAAASIILDPNDNQSATVDSPYVSPLTVTVLDANGNPVPDASVTFTLPTSGASGTLSATSGTTNAYGQLSETLTANDTPGNFSIGVTVDSGSDPSGSFQLTNLPAGSIAVNLLNDNQSATVGTAYGNPLIVAVNDAEGDPVAGVGVTFTLPTTGAGGTLLSITGTTNAQGEVSETLTANETAGSFAIQVDVTEGTAITKTFHMTNDPSSTPISVVSTTVNGDLLNVTSSISSAVENSGSNSVQITTSSPDGFYVGELVKIDGVATAGFNGTYTVASVIDATDFTYTDSNSTSLGISNGGTAVNALAGSQRSMVDSVVYQFNQAVTLGSGTISMAVNSGYTGTAGALPGTISTTTIDDGHTWLVTFSGSNVTGNSLADGVYDITLNSADVTADAGSGTLAASQTDTFFRLFGDANGDAAVTSRPDAQQFAGTFGSSSASSAYLAYFDYNADGSITSRPDVQNFASRFGTSLTGFTPTI